jgi:superfamily II RNA helicase
MASNKKKKEMIREIQDLKDSFKFIESDKQHLIKYNGVLANISKVKREYYDLELVLNNNIQIILGYLVGGGYIILDPEDVANYILTPLGFVSTHLKEVHCLVFGKLIHEGTLDRLSSRQLVALFSCFTNISVGDEFKAHRPKCADNLVKDLVLKVKEEFEKCQNFETETQITTGTNYEMHYDLLEYMGQWCDATSVEECKLVLQQIELEKGIFLGEFVKAVLKINNISGEMEKVCESIGNIELLSRIREISGLTLKFVATTQSLYI